MASVELSVDANLSGLRQQLESIPGLTAEQARLMTAELNKSIKASERAAKAAADASKRSMQQASAAASEASAKVASVGDKFGTVGSSAGKLAGALSLLGPALGDSARNVADLADVGEVGALAFEGLGAVMLPVVAVLALFAAGLAPIGELLADAEERAAAAAKAIEDFGAASASAGDASEDLGKRLAAINDEIAIRLKLETADEQAIRSKTDALYASVDALDATYSAETDAARALLESTRTEYGLLGAKVLSSRATEEQAARYRVLGEQVNSATKTIATNTQRVEAARAAADRSVETLKDLAAEEEREKGKAIAAAKAKEAQAAASKAHAEAMALEAAQQRALDAVRAKAASIISSEVSQAGRIIEQQRELRAELEKNPAAFGSVTAAIAVLDRQLAALDDQEIDAYLKRQAAAAGELKTAFEALIPPDVPTRQEQFATLTDQVTQAMRDGIITFDDYEQKLADIQAAQEETFSLETLDAFFSGVQSKTSQVFSDISAVSDYFMAESENALAEAIAARKALGKDATSDEKKQAKERVEDARDASRKQFELTKALQIAQITINTAGAVAQALASSPPPFNAIAAIAAGAAGAVQLATVQATTPKFHKGGLIGQPDESMAVVRAGEAVLNPIGRSMLGDNAIREANAGISGGHGGGAVQIVYKHKSFDYFVRDHLRTNATLPRALNAGRRLGQRG
jgi:hypothetical protein